MRRAVIDTLALLVASPLFASACGFEHGSLGGPDFSSDGGLDAPSAPWLADFSARKPIAITPPTLTASLAEFPVGVIAASDASLAAGARDDGRDIVFTAADGTTRLDHELVTFDGASGALETWVRLPQLANGTTTIWMYYGGAAQAPVTATWPSPFAGVWHFDAGAGAFDSTQHGHAAFAALPTTTPATVDGIAGHARSFDGEDDSMTAADPADGSLDFDMSSFSFSLWVNAAASSSMFDSPLYKGGASTGDPGYCVLLGTGNWNVKLHDGTSYRDPIAGTETDGTWVYLVGVVDRGAQQMLAYRNGAFMTMQSLANFGSVSNSAPLTFGPNGTLMPFHGILDEVHIVNGLLSPDWIAAEYANLTSPTFTVRGAPQTAP